MIIQAVGSGHNSRCIAFYIRSFIYFLSKAIVGKITVIRFCNIDYFIQIRTEFGIFSNRLLSVFPDLIKILLTDKRHLQRHKGASAYRFFHKSLYGKFKGSTFKSSCHAITDVQIIVIPERSRKINLTLGQFRYISDDICHVFIPDRINRVVLSHKSYTECYLFPIRVSTFFRTQCINHSYLSNQRILP